MKKLFAFPTLFIFATGMFATGCTVTPEAYHKANVRVGCRALKKCEEDDWKAAKYDSVSDCVDKSLKVFSAEDFADACKDYDRAKARKCLRASRKAKRKCDNKIVQDESACAEICGSIGLEGLELDDADFGLAIAQQREGGEDDLDLEDDLEDDFEDDVDADEDALLAAEIDAIMAEED